MRSDATDNSEPFRRGPVRRITVLSLAARSRALVGGAQQREGTSGSAEARNLVDRHKAQGPRQGLRQRRGHLGRQVHAVAARGQAFPEPIEPLNGLGSRLVGRLRGLAAAAGRWRSAQRHSLRLTGSAGNLAGSAGWRRAAGRRPAPSGSELLPRRVESGVPVPLRRVVGSRTQVSLMAVELLDRVLPGAGGGCGAREESGGSTAISVAP